MLYVARGVAKHERMTEHAVVEKYSVLPQQYADFATLRGDASDGLPGVAGVGDKTAASLLLSYGDLSGIRAAAADPGSALGPGPRGKIIAAADYLDVAPDRGGRGPRHRPRHAGHDAARASPHDPEALAAARRALGLVQPGRAPHRGADGR